MTEARAYLRHARISPRKVQIVLDLIRNKPVNEAAAILKYTPKAACEPLGTLLASAEGRYMKLPVDKIVESETPISDMNWRMLDVENAPEYIELPY